MDLTTTMGRLEAAGTAQNRKVYPRHGVREPMFGASYADLGRLQKQIKVDHELARRLWETGNHDARIFAVRIADPAAITSAFADAWLRDVDNYVLMEELGRLVARSPVGASRAKAWRDRKAEWPSSTGWAVTASLVLAGAVPQAEQLSLVEQIEREIAARPNRTRHEMNAVLIAIGMQGEPMRERALEVAATMGPVRVDHGQTECVTPDVAAYIARAEARAKAR
ncbi:MAG: DNA alkylation repair protein [Actinomycetota bacterium]